MRGVVCPVHCASRAFGRGSEPGPRDGVHAGGSRIFPFPLASNDPLPPYVRPVSTMNYRLFRTALCIAALCSILSSCDDMVTDPTTVNYYLLNGDGFSNSKVTGSGTATVLPVSNTINISIIGLLNGQSSSLELNINATMPGTYPWSSDDAIEVITNKGVFKPLIGSTTVDSVEHGMVRGRFSGTVRNKFDHSVMVEVTGEFNALR